MLVNGKWTSDWDPVSNDQNKGRFDRKPSTFRNWVTPDGIAGPTGEDGFKAEAGRYHLYVSLNCPWASRTLVLRKLKKLDDVISVDIVEPVISDYGWRFGDYPGSGKDSVNGAAYLHENYTKADPNFSGRVTVPVLWDKQRGTIVNNESADIIRMMNSAFDEFGDASVDLYPQELAGEIDTLNKAVYDKFNNGVYRTGFAQSQEAYEEGVRDVFAMLDELEERLSDGRAFIHGDKLTETDVRIFMTTIRFDAAYYTAFKCNIRRIQDYPNVQAHLKRMLALPGVAETVSIDHIKRGYFSIKKINPLRIIAAGPVLEFEA
jgi:putative glutathione S-transferase